jgi:hypothetical protein
LDYSRMSGPMPNRGSIKIVRISAKISSQTLPVYSMAHFSGKGGSHGENPSRNHKIEFEKDKNI